MCLACRINHRADDHEKLHLEILAAEDPDSMTDHQVKRHQMFQERANHKAQDQATRRQVAIETVGLREFQEEQTVKFRKNYSKWAARGVPRKLDEDTVPKPSGIKRAIKRKGAKYPPFFFNMMKNALKTWIDECGDTHIFKDFTFRIFDILLDRMDDVVLPPGVVGGEFLNPVPRVEDGRVRYVQVEYYKAIYHFCNVDDGVAPAGGNTKCFNVKKEFLQDGEAGEAARLTKRKNRARIDREWEVLKCQTHIGRWNREIKNEGFLNHVMEVMDDQWTNTNTNN